MFIQIGNMIFNVNEIKSIRINSTAACCHRIEVALANEKWNCMTFRHIEDAEEKIKAIYAELSERRNSNEQKNMPNDRI